MPKTVKQLDAEISKEKYDVTRLPVKIDDKLTGELYDIDEITVSANGVYLVVNTSIDEGEE